MSKSLKITSFGAQSLHNSTGTIKNVQVRDSGPQGINSLMVTLNGALYDADGSDANTGIPGSVEVDILVNGTGSASFAALDGAILGLRQTKATLTGEDVDGTELTCTARCTSIPAISTLRTFGIYRGEYTLTFNKQTEWS